MVVGGGRGASIEDGEYLGMWGGRGSCRSERQEVGKLRYVKAWRRPVPGKPWMGTKEHEAAGLRVESIWVSVGGGSLLSNGLS